MKLWKVFGMAGLAGVAATGVAVARAERQRRSFEPDEVRARLHERYREALPVDAAAPTKPQPGADKTAPRRLRKSWALLASIGRRRRNR